MKAKANAIKPKEFRRRFNECGASAPRRERSPLQEACDAVADELNELLNAASDPRNRDLEWKIENLIGRFFDLQGELQGVEHELRTRNHFKENEPRQSHW